MAEELQNGFKEDTELSEILDSALEDFDKADQPKEKVEKPEEKPGEKPEEGSDDDLKLDNEWSQEFINQGVKRFEADFLKIMGFAEQGAGAGISDKKLQDDLEHMAAAAQVFLNQDGGEMSSDFASTITQAVQGLSLGPDQNLPSGSGDQGSLIPPYIQGMIQTLLSKEVLYPSLKDVLDRFPEWLETNKEKLSAEDISRYENQQKLMKDVCNLLDQERDSDTKEIKDQRFEEVLNLMQKLQDYGQPPTELVGDLAPTPDLNNCSIM